MASSPKFAVFRPTSSRFAVADLGCGSETDTEPEPVVPVPVDVVLSNLVVVEVATDRELTASLCLLSKELYRSIKSTNASAKSRALSGRTIREIDVDSPPISRTVDAEVITPSLEWDNNTMSPSP